MNESLGAGMKYRLFLLGLILPLTCLLSALVYAEEDQGRLFWVVGSFADQKVAMGEGERIGRVTGLEVVYTSGDVKGTTYYRLLVPRYDDVEDQDRVRLQLGAADIANPWLLKIDDTLTRHLSLSVAPRQEFYLVLGSFEKYEDAQQHADHILESYNQIAELREFTKNGESVIRVMTGPYMDQAEIEAAREKFENSEIEDAWIIEVASQDQDLMDDYEPYEDVDYKSYEDVDYKSYEDVDYKSYEDVDYKSYEDVDYKSYEDVDYKSYEDVDDEPYEDVEYFDVPESKPDRELILREATRESTQVPENTINPGYNLARLKRRPEG
jgi:hypothetical protein